MYKILIILAILEVSNAQELTISQASKLRTYNHSPSGKIRDKRLLRLAAVIKQDEAYEIAKKSCNSDVNFSKLSVRSNRLFYTLSTNKGHIKIDALDGKIMKKCEK